MSQSLSVVLAVYNGESTLSEKTHNLLDMLPDLTHCFELLLVDDASTDQTSEVGMDLCREYPQVQFVRHNQKTGWPGIVETALSRTWGEFLFVQDANGAIDSSKFKRLWGLRLSPEITSNLESLNSGPSNPRRMAALGIRLDDGDRSSNGLQMIRRTHRPVIKGYLTKPAQATRTRVDKPQHRSSATLREISLGSISAYSATP